MKEPARTAAFRTYVVADRSRLLRAARLLTAGDEHAAEDLVQIALTRLYVAWPRVTRAEGPGAYARRILVNAFIDETRRPWRRRELSTHELPDVAAPDDILAGSADHVLAALAQLPPRQRAVVVLRFMLDLDVESTARALDCAPGTVKSQTAHALSKLRDLLGAELTSSTTATISGGIS
jgi:RNA polymerase sigma-70 factor (sigma-E family)